MPSTGTLGGTLPSGPKSLKVKHQAYPHDGSRGLKRPAPASPPVTDNHHGAGAKGATDVAENLDHWTNPQEGLSEDLLTNPEEIWYNDGSSFVLDGAEGATGCGR